jgi:hypothetical protein
MKRAMFCGLLLLGCLERGLADWVLVQRVEGGMQSGAMTVHIKEGKSRVDIADQLSTLTDGGSGDVITLLHGQKSYMKIPADRTRALLEKMQSLKPDSGASSPKLVPAGRKETVEGRECEVFTWAGPGVSATYWVAKDYPKAADLAAAMEKNLSAGLAGLAGGLTPRPSDFPGMVIRAELTINGQKVTTQLVSAEEKPVNPALFEVPSGYKELPTPQFDFPVKK